MLHAKKKTTRRTTIFDPIPIQLTRLVSMFFSNTHQHIPIQLPSFQPMTHAIQPNFNPIYLFLNYPTRLNYKPTKPVPFTQLTKTIFNFELMGVSFVQASRVSSRLTIICVQLASKMNLFYNSLYWLRIE